MGTEDQINALSAEFDLRAQDDGVIKNKDSLEKLNEDINTTGTTTSKMTESPEERELVRKTSYTEIKFSQPSSQENGTTTDVVSYSQSYDSNDCKDIYISDSHSTALAVEEKKTITTEIIEITTEIIEVKSEPRIQSNLESASVSAKSTEGINQKECLEELSNLKDSEILLNTETSTSKSESFNIYTENVDSEVAVHLKSEEQSISSKEIDNIKAEVIEKKSESKNSIIIDTETSTSKSESFNIHTENVDSEVAVHLKLEEQSISSKQSDNIKTEVSEKISESKNSIIVDSTVNECKKADRGRSVKTEKIKQLSNKKDQTKDKVNEIKGKKTVNISKDQTKIASKEKKQQRDTKSKADVCIAKEKKSINKVDMKQKNIDSKLTKQQKVNETKVDIKTSDISKK